MATIERIRLPENVYTALRRECRGSASFFVAEVIKDYVTGNKDLVVPPHAEKTEKDTSITADETLMKSAKEYAKAKGLSFNKAVVMMLEQSLQGLKQNRRKEDVVAL